MPQNLDFAQWNFSNVQLAPAKLKLVAAGDATVITGDVAVEAAARIAADTVLTNAINELSKSYAHSLLLGGM